MNSKKNKSKTSWPHLFPFISFLVIWSILIVVPALIIWDAYSTGRADWFWGQFSIALDIIWIIGLLIAIGIYLRIVAKANRKDSDPDNYSKNSTSSSNSKVSKIRKEIEEAREMLHQGLIDKEDFEKIKAQIIEDNH